jgi:hypothetical protein
MRRSKWREIVYAVAAVLLAILAAGAGWFGISATIAKRLAIANESRAFAALARTANDRGVAFDGAELALL